MNDIGLAIEFIDYGSPWVADYCSIADIDSDFRIIITESGSIDVGMERQLPDTASYLILTQDGTGAFIDSQALCPVSISLQDGIDNGYSGDIYLESSDYTINRFNTPYYGVAVFDDVLYTMSSSNSSSYALGLQQSDNDILTINEGIYVDSGRMFIPENESQNSDGSYKRLIYNQIKNTFYDNPLDLTNITDTKNKILYNRFKVVSMAQPFYGEQILENSVVINERNGLLDYTIVDDGNGNLYVKDRVFSTIIDDQNRGNLCVTASANEYYTRRHNMGYSVSVGDVYCAVGSPCFDRFISSVGFVDIYKYDALQSNKMGYNKTIVRNTTAITGSNINVITSDFGKSVDVCGSLCAISSTNIQYYFNNVSSSMYTDKFGIVEIYDLNSTSSLPVACISQSMVPCEYDTGVNTFGQKISINNEYIAIGCPYTYQIDDSGSYQGAVYIFSGNPTLGYTFNTALTGSNRSNDILFGRDLKIDKGFNKLIVGNGNYNRLTGSNAYLFEFIDGSWINTLVFDSPVKKTENLNFVDIQPYSSSYGLPDGFGTSVSIYCSSSLDYSIAIGAPFDRVVSEYSGSACDKNGAVYIYDHQYCILRSGSIESYVDDGFVLTRVSGNDKTFKNNRFGHAIDLNNNKLVVSSPKYLSELPPDYYNDTVFVNLITDHCSDEAYLGMIHIYERSETESTINYISGSSALSSTNITGVVNVPTWTEYATVKPKKLYGQPHCFYAYDVATFGDNLVVGNPIVLTIPRVMLSSMNARPDILQPNDLIVDVEPDKIKFVKNLQGNFNILNFIDYEAYHHIGNVFYKSGKMVTSTSGSIFDTIFETSINDHYKYDISFKNKVRIYEKEIICTVNPGEFNYSTNPTSYNYYPISELDLNHNGTFDFEDCDKILRGIYFKFTGTETWWDLFDNFSSTTDYDTTVENSLFNYYVTGSSSGQLLTAILTDSDKNLIINQLNSVLDINGDGIVDFNDLQILWKYFTNHLTIHNFSSYQTSKCIAGPRATYSLALTYLHQICGVSSLPTILDTFYSGSTGPTSSYLTPYITTIGLYNGLDLVATAKLGTPIKNLGHFPLNFIIRLDM